MKTILVIAPHADDEVLGLGGYLLHHKDNSRIVLVIGTIGGENERQNLSQRIDEFIKVCEQLDCSDCEILFRDMDAKMDTIPSVEIISKLDAIIDRYRPDEIFLNCKSHHQDHNKMYECAMASLRMREGYVPKFVALYEYPCLDSGIMVEGGRWYHDISDVIDQKCQLFQNYASQIRSYPSPLNDEGIRQLAASRGRECAVPHAEMFYIHRMYV